MSVHLLPILLRLTWKFFSYDPIKKLSRLFFGPNLDQHIMGSPQFKNQKKTPPIILDFCGPRSLIPGIPIISFYGSWCYQTSKKKFGKPRSWILHLLEAGTYKRHILNCLHQRSAEVEVALRTQGEKRRARKDRRKEGERKEGSEGKRARKGKRRIGNGSKEKEGGQGREGKKENK